MSQNTVNIDKSTTYLFPDSVCVMAVDDRGLIIFVEQFRRPSARNTLEIPGGTASEKESLHEAAKREFQEETGLEIGECIFLFTLDLDLSTAIQRTHIFKSSVLNKLPANIGEFKVRRESLHQAINMIRSGEITHAPTVASIFSFMSEY